MAEPTEDPTPKTRRNWVPFLLIFVGVTGMIALVATVSLVGAGVLACLLVALVGVDLTR